MGIEKAVAQAGFSSGGCFEFGCLARGLDYFGVDWLPIDFCKVLWAGEATK